MSQIDTDTDTKSLGIGLFDTIPIFPSVSVFPQLHDFSEAVFSGDLHPRLDGVCVTGGEDDKAYVWNWKTGDVLFEAADFKDSVVFARFNQRDGSLLALADMAGNIKVHRVTAPATEDAATSNVSVSKEVVWEFETSDITVKEITFELY